MATDLQSMEQIVSNVFDAMLMMPTSPIVAEVAAGDCPRVVAAIKISGAVNELVVVEAPLVTAALIAETMFDAGPGSLQQDEIEDAVGEVVNMIKACIRENRSSRCLASLTRSEKQTFVTQPHYGLTLLDCRSSPAGRKWQHRRVLWTSAPNSPTPLTLRNHPRITGVSNNESSYRRRQSRNAHDRKANTWSN